MTSCVIGPVVQKMRDETKIPMSAARLLPRVIRVERFNGFQITMHRSTENVVMINVELWKLVYQIYLNNDGK
jgi:hypothetical protein